MIFLALFSVQVQAECVILLHGLARTSGSMDKLERHLLQEHYKVINQDYPSRHFDIETLTDLAIQPALAACGDNTKISFVTHSLGGILVRNYLSSHDIPNLHHVVMLGPPNQGSEVVDELANVPGFYWLNGKAGMQLGTDKESIPNSLGEAEFDVGIVAGTRTINFILSMLIPGRDDGKVSVERTKLAGMSDHIVLPVTHTFMMRNKQVIEQVKNYLRYGQFARD